MTVKEFIKFCGVLLGSCAFASIITIAINFDSIYAALLTSSVLSAIVACFFTSRMESWIRDTK